MRGGDESCCWALPAAFPHGGREIFQGIARGSRGRTSWRSPPGLGSLAGFPPGATRALKPCPVPGNKPPLLAERQRNAISASNVLLTPSPEPRLLRLPMQTGSISGAAPFSPAPFAPVMLFCFFYFLAE